MVTNRLHGVSAIILAGGLGTRIRDLYPGIPKPLVPVFGKTFIDWVVLFWQSLGIGEITISAGHLGEQFVDHFANSSVSVVVEDELLGTGGGMINAHKSRRGSASRYTLVCNGDSLLLSDFVSLADTLANGNIEVLLIGVKVMDCTRYGRLEISETGRLSSLIEKEATGSGIINSGIYIFKNTLLDYLIINRMPVSLEREIIPDLLVKKVPIEVFLADGSFLDIGTVESVSKAEGFIRENQNYF